MSAAGKAWDELNDRQRSYLSVFYNQDQLLEQEHRRRAAAGRFSSAPTRTWRRIAFNSTYSPVTSTLRSRGVYDSGAGATLAALRERGLIDTETEPGLLNDQVSVWVTRAGRAAVRAGLGIPPRPRPPKGLLSERLWRQLASVASAERDGTRLTQLQGETHLRLAVGYEQYGSRGYLEWDRHVVAGYYLFTETGRAHYREHRDTYLKLYPGVDAPELT